MSQAEVVGAILMVLVFLGLGVVGVIIHRNRNHDRDTVV